MLLRLPEVLCRARVLNPIWFDVEVERLGIPVYVRKCVEPGARKRRRNAPFCIRDDGSTYVRINFCTSSPSSRQPEKGLFYAQHKWLAGRLQIMSARTFNTW